ncbi:MAG TPA: hypothetical protein VHD81_07650 [Mycobacteriales bacterium]|nr:hypothetical protein [Mycobacteriales bacterium]
MKRVWLAVVTVLLAGACGSRLPHPAPGQVATSTSADGLGLAPVAPAPVAATTASPGSGVSVPAANPGSNSTQPVSTGSSRVPATTVAPTARNAQPNNHAPIQLGFITTTVGNAQSLGVNAGQSYSDQDMWSALVTEYNKHGGLDGHRIEPVYGSTDTASSNWASQFSAVCAKFTQDHHVQAVIGYIFVFLPSFESCLANANVPHLYGGYQPGDLVDQQQYPTLVSTANPTTDGALLTALDGGLRSGLLTTSTKLGLLLDTCADGDRAYQRTIEPWLKAHRLNFQTVLGKCSQGSSDVSSAVSAVSNAELRFASSGVKVVMGGGVPLLLFMETAETQHYHPQYLTIVGGAALEANAPPDQMLHLHGFGWLPAVDVDPTHQPMPRSPAQKRCLAMLAKHGLQAKQYNDFLGAYSACDGLNLYAKALAAGAATPQEVASDVAAAEAGLSGALTYGGELRATSTQRGGPAVYRQYGWLPTCRCLTYRGPTYPIPSP